MAASHPFAGGGIGDRHPEQGEAEDDEDEIEHERGPRGRSGQGPLVAPSRMNVRYPMRRRGINNA